MNLPEWAVPVLSTITPDFLIDSNRESDNCIAFFYDTDGKLYLSEPGQYHSELRDSVGVDFNGSADSPQALAGRFGPVRLKDYENTKVYPLNSVTVPVVCFYQRYSSSETQNLIKPCLRELLSHLAPDTLYCAYGEPLVPVSSLFGGKVKSTYGREMTRQGLLAPGHSIRAMHSEGFEDKLSRILESL